MKELGSPCATLKFKFNGFNTGPKNCTFKFQEVRIWRTLNGTYKDFNSPLDFLYPGSGGGFYQSVEGNIYRKIRGNEVTVSVPSEFILNANVPFEFVIPGNLTISARVYVCFYAQLDCDGTLCTIGPICFNDYIPCI